MLSATLPSQATQGKIPDEATLLVVLGRNCCRAVELGDPVGGRLALGAAVGELGVAEDGQDLGEVEVVLGAELEPQGPVATADVDEFEALVVGVDRQLEGAPDAVGHALAARRERCRLDDLRVDERGDVAGEQVDAPERGRLDPCLVLDLLGELFEALVEVADLVFQLVLGRHMDRSPINSWTLNIDVPQQMDYLHHELRCLWTLGESGVADARYNKHLPSRSQRVNTMCFRQ